jgi:hypothetical protein
MPESLTRKTTLAEATCGWPASARNGGRLQIGMAAGFMSEWVAGFASEPWPASIGMTGRHHSESADLSQRDHSSLVLTTSECFSTRHR